jgi:hypothetical protein
LLLRETALSFPGGMKMKVARALKSVGYWLNPVNLLLRSGIRVKLQLAFGAAALMTVVASAVAIMSFRSTGTT